jgi:hypothetical protein
MRTAYQQYLNAWQQGGGGLILHYYGIGEPEPKNFFSMLDHLHQPSTPKYLALMDYLGTSSTYVAPRKAYVAPVVERQQAPRAPAPQPQVQRQAPPPQVQRQAPAQNNWDKFLEPAPRQAARQPAPVVRAQAGSPLSGAGIQGWARTGNSTISPPITLQRGARNRLSLLWHYTNATRAGNQFFRLYAMDSRGGRKLLLEQPAADIAEIGNFDQLFEEDVSRYVGPPIRLMIETSPGLNTVIEKLTY